jgi:prolyl 4-hydroxylase
MKNTQIFIILVIIILCVILCYILYNNNIAGFYSSNDTYVIKEIPNFLTKEECDTIIKISTNKLFESALFEKEGDIKNNNIRISKQCWLDNSEDPIINNISQRIAEATKTDIKLQEQMQVVKYDENGFYTPHYDACDSTIYDYCDRMNQNMGARYITFIIYLNDDFEAGETLFPHINQKVIPQMGKGVIFYNTDEKGIILKKSLHGGLNVKNGSKWIANKWIHYGK